MMMLSPGLTSDRLNHKPTMSSAGVNTSWGMGVPLVSKSPNMMTSSINAPNAAVVDNSAKHSSAASANFDPSFMTCIQWLFVKNFLAVVFVESLKQPGPIDPL